MRNHVFVLVIVIAAFMHSACSIKTANNKDSLSDFTQDILKAYIDDIAHSEISPENDVLVIYTYKDTNYYYIRIYSLDKYFRSHISAPIMGKAKYLGFTTYITGIPVDLFYKTDAVPEKMPIISKSLVVIDPSYYEIYINKRMELDYLRTYRININGDISQIESIVYKHFKTFKSYESADQRVFLINEVQHPPVFPGGINALDSFININFEIDDMEIQQRSKESRTTLVCIKLFIDMNGNALYKGISQSSGVNEVDQEAIRVAKLIAVFRFTPAQHRGCNVNVEHPLVFYDWY